MVEQRRDQARHRLPQGLGEPGALEGRLGAQGRRRHRAAAGQQARRAAKIFANPHLPEIDDYYEPFTFDYDFISVGTGDADRAGRAPGPSCTEKRMEKIEWGPNWEEILGGEFAKRSKDYNFADIEKEIYGEFENTFMITLPRICEHCLNPSCVASCPSGSIYKREEDGIVLIDQDKCRGWRMCVSGCPYKKIYYNWTTGKAEKCIFCYPRIEAGEPTVCSETCVGRIRYLGVMLYDADGIERAAAVEDPQDLYQAQLDVFLDPHDPAVQAQARADGVPEKWLEAARTVARVQDGDRLEDRVSAASRIPDAADGLVRAAAVADQRPRQRGPTRRRRWTAGRAQPAHSRALSRQPADRRQGGAGGARAGAPAGHARVLPRAAARRHRQPGAAGAVGLSDATGR